MMLSRILFWAIVAVLITILIMQLPAIGWSPFEHMCGGSDQLCVCSGNETMMGNKNGTPKDNDLSKALAGN